MMELRPLPDHTSFDHDITSLTELPASGQRGRKLNSGLHSALTNERGNVESALVLIPLMILFLSVAQIGLSVYSRNITGSLAQGEVAYQAIGATSSSGASDASGLLGATSTSNLPTNSFEKSVIDPNSSSTIAMPLPGGGSVLVGEKTVKSPIITPLLPQGDIFNVQGIAIQE